MNLGRWIDRAVGVASPRRGLMRAMDRHNLELVSRQTEQMRRFEAATAGRRGADWPRSSGTIDSELRGALSALRARSRDAEQNNAWASSAIRCLQADLVGSGFGWALIDRHNPDDQVDDASATPVRRAWTDWSDTKRCDLRARHNLATICSVATREMLVAGEVLIRRVWTGEEPIPFRLQMLEADYLDTTKDGFFFEDGRRIVQGVEIDRVGRVLAYWLYREHPGDYGAIVSMQSDRVRAEDVLHVFEPIRAGQLRGMPRGTSCLLVLKDDDAHFDARLVQQKVAANFVGFVHDLTSDIGGPAVSQVLGDQATSTDDPQTRRFVPGTFQTLASGKTITFGAPPSVDGWADVQSLTLRKIAAGFDVPYVRISRDVKGTSYSSGRTETIQYNSGLDLTTWHVLVPDLMDGVFGWVKEGLKLMQIGGDVDRLGASWDPPRRVVVDPTKDIPALQQEVRAGFKSRADACRELGQDEKRIDAQNKASFANAEAAGLIYTSDAHIQEQGGEPAPEAAPGQGDGKPKPKPKGNKPPE